MAQPPPSIRLHLGAQFRPGRCAPVRRVIPGVFSAVLALGCTNSGLSEGGKAVGGVTVGDGSGSGRAGGSATSGDGTSDMGAVNSSGGVVDTIGSGVAEQDDATAEGMDGGAMAWSPLGGDDSSQKRTIDGMPST